MSHRCKYCCAVITSLLVISFFLIGITLFGAAVRETQHTSHEHDIKVNEMKQQTLINATVALLQDPFVKQKLGLRRELFENQNYEVLLNMVRDMEDKLSHETLDEVNEMFEAVYQANRSELSHTSTMSFLGVGCTLFLLSCFLILVQPGFSTRESSSGDLSTLIDDADVSRHVRSGVEIEFEQVAHVGEMNDSQVEGQLLESNL